MISVNKYGSHHFVATFNNGIEYQRTLSKTSRIKLKHSGILMGSSMFSITPKVKRCCVIMYKEFER